MERMTNPWRKIRSCMMLDGITPGLTLEERVDIVTGGVNFNDNTNIATWSFDGQSPNVRVNPRCSPVLTVALYIILTKLSVTSTVAATCHGMINPYFPLRQTPLQKRKLQLHLLPVSPPRH